MSQRVAVVGAGPSGLVTVKELLDEGHAVTCFERAEHLGGVFRFGETDGVLWDSCRLTSSGLLTAFSDFPVPPDRAEHMTAGEYADYLATYCDAFDVRRRIRFGTTVTSVTRHPSGGWTVRTRRRDGATDEERYDAVAVCSGLHQHPHRPRFPGEESFTGQILHGSQYRRPGQVQGKRVLIVGAGESGADVVAEVAEAAADTVLSLRRGVAVRPRKIHGMPNDYLTSRINNSAAHWVFQTRHPRDTSKRWIYRAAFLPALLVERCLQTFASIVYEILPIVILPIVHPRRRLGGAAAVVEAGTRLRTRRLIGQLLRESGGRLGEQFATKSDDFVRAIATRRCRRVGPVARFDDRRVVFEDGASFEPDVVLLCTGFETRIPFLDDTVARTPRYLHAFDPAIGKSLAFIGFLRPALGAIPPLSELQARWFALLLSGKIDLPSESEMRRSIDRQVDFRRHVFRAVPARLDELVDFTSFCDDLAAGLGCKPTREAVGRESLAFRLRFFAAPFVAAQYRLIGPHAKPWIARQVISDLPIAHPAPMLAAYYLHWALSRLLSRLLGAEFAPKLSMSAR